MFYSWGRIKSGQAELRPRPSPARVTVRRAQSPAQGQDRLLQKPDRRHLDKGSYWKEIKIGLKKENFYFLLNPSKLDKRIDDDEW